MNHIRRFRNVARVTLRDMSLKISNHGISRVPYEINDTGELQYTPITAFVMLSFVGYPHVIFFLNQARSPGWPLTNTTRGPHMLSPCEGREGRKERGGEYMDEAQKVR